MEQKAKGKLYLVRHGESMGNAWKEAYKADERNFLTPYGVLQAQLAGQYFHRQEITLHHVYSSNLTRARHTMAAILHETDDWQRPWLNLPALNEMSDKDDPDEEQRVRDAFHNIFTAWTEGNILIVSHYHVMQVIFDYLPVERKDIGSHEGRHVGNGQIFMWDPDDDWRVVLLDMTRLGEQT